MNTRKKTLTKQDRYLKASAIEITTRVGCSVSCVYCPQKKLSIEYAKHSNILELKMNVFKTCLDKIPPYVHIVFGGMSEPFLNPECIEMILYAAEKKRGIGVTTTLVGIKPSDMRIIKNVNFEFFYMHLPGDQKAENIQINDEYLRLLREVLESNISACYISHGKQLHPKLQRLLKGKRIIRPPMISRSGNIKISGKMLPEKSKGLIGCRRDCRWNVLLPNADVLLCSNDYSMQHVIGNLLNTDYYSLFKNPEYIKIKAGLQDDSMDILCRHCDTFSYPKNMLTKLLYRPYQSLRRLKYYITAKAKEKPTFLP